MTRLFQPEIHQATLDKLIQNFPKVINDMNVLESELFEYQGTPDEAHAQCLHLAPNILTN